MKDHSEISIAKLAIRDEEKRVLIANSGLLTLQFALTCYICSTIKLTASAPPRQREAIPLLAPLSFMA